MRCRTVFDYCLYRPIYKPQLYDEDVASEVQEMHEKVAVQMKDKTFI